MQLSDVTIGVTSFLRPGYLRVALGGLRRNFTDCDIIVADDSDSPVDDIVLPNKLIALPFDTGLSIKRNRLVNATKTRYFLLGTDDFEFNKKARAGVELMYQVLESNPDIDVAGGRYNTNEFEGHIKYVPGEYLQEIPLYRQTAPYSANPTTYRVDMTANYFLARTNRMEKWEESMKIGGEHVMWFLKMMEEGKVVVWVPGAEIDSQYPTDVDPRYSKFRKRCWINHARMKEILNIKRYISFTGDVT